jgi:ribosomal protein S18 acetylase RimI-like enzyme
VSAAIEGTSSPEALLQPETADRVRQVIDDVLRDCRLRCIDGIFHDLCFACSLPLLRRRRDVHCRRLVDEGIPPVEGLKLPTECFPDRPVYGVVVDGRVVSVAWAHQTGVMDDKIACVGIATAPAHRRRGCAATALSMLVEHFAATGGEAYYCCDPDNAASVATARSVGFAPYATSLILDAPPPLS